MELIEHLLKKKEKFAESEKGEIEKLILFMQ